MFLLERTLSPIITGFFFLSRTSWSWNWRNCNKTNWMNDSTRRIMYLHTNHQPRRESRVSSLWFPHTRVFILVSDGKPSSREDDKFSRRRRRRSPAQGFATWTGDVELHLPSLTCLLYLLVPGRFFLSRPIYCLASSINITHPPKERSCTIFWLISNSNFFYNLLWERVFFFFGFWICEWKTANNNYEKGKWEIEPWKKYIVRLRVC